MIMPKGLVIIFVTIFALGVSVVAVDYLQLNATSKRKAEREVELIAAISQQALATQHYQFVEHLFAEWGAAYPDVIAIVLRNSDDGTVVARYARPQGGGHSVITSDTVIERGHLTLTLISSKENVNNSLKKRALLISLMSLSLAVVAALLFRAQREKVWAIFSRYGSGDKK